MLIGDIHNFNIQRGVRNNRMHASVRGNNRCVLRQRDKVSDGRLSEDDNSLGARSRETIT